MNKSVYSLVLMDEVVQAIDALAYSLGMSRSNLINQILAEKTEVLTPRQCMQNIFESMSKLLLSHQHFQIQQQASDSMYSIRSILRYKYNPTIKYAITLDKKSNCLIGILKVISRTQSQKLQEYLNHFFEMWSDFERIHHLKGWTQDEKGKWERSFKIEYQVSLQVNETLAEAIALYIQVVDEALQIYFLNYEDLHIAHIKLYKHYQKYLQRNSLLF